MTEIQDISDFAAEIGFPYRTFIEPVLMDLLEKAFAREAPDPDPLRHLVIPLRMFAWYKGDSRQDAFSITAEIDGQRRDPVSIVIRLRSSAEGDYVVAVLDESR